MQKGIGEHLTYCHDEKSQQNMNIFNEIKGIIIPKDERIAALLLTLGTRQVHLFLTLLFIRRS